jgi:hypothetical protein
MPRLGLFARNTPKLTRSAALVRNDCALPAGGQRVSLWLPRPRCHAKSIGPKRGLTGQIAHKGLPHYRPPNAGPSSAPTPGTRTSTGSPAAPSAAKPSRTSTSPWPTPSSWSDDSYAPLEHLPLGQPTPVLTAASVEDGGVAFVDEGLLAMGLVELRGLRRGEAAGLCGADVDLIEATLRISRTLQQHHGGPVLLPPKTAAGARTLALARRTVAVLSAHRDHTREVAGFDRPRNSSPKHRVVGACWLFWLQGTRAPQQ